MNYEMYTRPVISTMHSAQYATSR